MEIPYTVTARPDTGLWNAKIGIWLFLASEVMLFGGLFSGYVFLRLGVTEGIDNPWPTRQLIVWPGFVNTIVLIASSVFVVFAWAELKMRNFARYQFWMRLVVLCALVFLGLKSYEYYGKFTHHGMKFEDDSVVEGVLQQDRIEFTATELSLSPGKGGLEFLKYLKDGTAPVFKTADGEEVRLTSSWIKNLRKSSGGVDAPAAVVLKPAAPLEFSFNPKKVQAYTGEELTFRDATVFKGALKDDKIYFEVHDIDLRMVEDDAGAMVFSYLGDARKDAYLEHRDAELKKAEEDGRAADPYDTDLMHIHPESHGAAHGETHGNETGGEGAADGHGYPVIEVERDHKKFLSNHGPAYNTYYAIYFTLTGLHGLHVLIGALVLTYFLFFQKKLYQKNPEHLANRVEVGGLFWHFVDLVWIFLFPIMYLM